ncbi:MAG: hypothetical protein GX941_09900 [Candidatus Methanofastidiosa archaeon]|nr:hypothetical protein [Candidatus Methanofastidiosa archaeon]
MNIDTIMEKVKQIIVSQTEKDDLGYDDLLLENGIDSVSMIEILVDIEETFGIEFDNTKLNYSLLRSIKSISEYAKSVMEKGNDL